MNKKIKNDTSHRNEDTKINMNDTALREWTKFVHEQTEVYRSTGNISLPVLSKNNSHAAQWGNKIVKDSVTLRGGIYQGTKDKL